MTLKTRNNEVAIDGARVRARREQCQFTQANTAYRARIATETLCRIENAGVGSVQKLTAGSIARVLRCKVTDLQPEAGDGK